MLERNNIKLRAIEPEDIDFIMVIENDPEVWKVSSTNNPYSRFDVEQYVMTADKDIYTAKQLRMIIEDSNGKTRLGIIDIFDFDAHHRRAGVGVILMEFKRGKGIAGLALDLMIEYAFEHLCLHQIYCNIGAGNDASIKLFESRGFKKSGTKKDWKIFNNKYEDELFYQLINQKK